MRKYLKWIGIFLASLLGLAAIIAITMTIRSNSRLSKTYNIQPEQIDIPSDAASLEEGERLVSIYCQGCHGKDLSGKEFFNDPALAVVDAANLTPGEGGAGSSFSDEDWVRAIRHGVDPEGRPLFIMPSGDFYYFSDEDLGQIIAYLQSLPPVDHVVREPAYGGMGKILMGLGVLGNPFSAETIDHEAPRPTAPEVGVSAEYGDYLVKTFGCRTCHGPELSGGPSPEPGGPPGPNLTPGGILKDMPASAFILIVRNGSSESMPFDSLKKMSDDELEAIWTYLQSLPALETTN